MDPSLTSISNRNNISLAWSDHPNCTASARANHLPTVSNQMPVVSTLTAPAIASPLLARPTTFSDVAIGFLTVSLLRKHAFFSVCALHLIWCTTARTLTNTVILLQLYPVACPRGFPPDWSTLSNSTWATNPVSECGGKGTSCWTDLFLPLPPLRHGMGWKNCVARLPLFLSTSNLFFGFPLQEDCSWL